MSHSFPGVSVHRRFSCFRSLLPPNRHLLLGCPGVGSIFEHLLEGHCGSEVIEHHSVEPVKEGKSSEVFLSLFLGRMGWWGESKNLKPTTEISTNSANRVCVNSVVKRSQNRCEPYSTHSLSTYNSVLSSPWTELMPSLVLPPSTPTFPWTSTSTRVKRHEKPKQFYTTRLLLRLQVKSKKAKTTFRWLSNRNWQPLNVISRFEAVSKFLANVNGTCFPRVIKTTPPEHQLLLSEITDGEVEAKFSCWKEFPDRNYRNIQLIITPSDWDSLTEVGHSQDLLQQTFDQYQFIHGVIVVQRFKFVERVAIRTREPHNFHRFP